MNRLLSRVGACALTAAFCLITVGRLSAQTTAAPASTTPAEEETIVLSPFVVEASEDTGYAAKNTLAGTRLRTELRDVGSSISVITAKFLKDTNSKNAEDLLVYTTGTEVAGQGGNFLGQGDGAVLTSTARGSPIQSTRVRGLAEADNTRDFFLSDIPWDSYNVGRVDLQRGPNSILFGIGSPAGIVNSSLNTASFKDSNKVEYQFGIYGTNRGTADFNKVILKNELAVRLSLLRDDTKYRQEPAFKNDHRAFGAVKWDPQFLNSGANHTSFRANFEKGAVRSNLPRQSPPLDAIIPWFQLGKPTVDTRTSSTDVTGPWFGSLGNRVWDGAATAFENGVQGISYPTQIKPWPNFTGTTDGSGVGDNTFRGIRTFDVFGNAAYPEGAIGAYKARSLTDTSIFDFQNSLLEGDNKREWNDFTALDAALSQTFFNGKVGFELAYNRQNASWGYDSLISSDGAVISVDMNRVLLDGSPNPNVGRPLTISNGSGAVSRSHRMRDVKRATVFAEMDFADKLGKDSGLGEILGRHVFTGLYANQTNDGDFRNGKRFFLSQQYAPKSNQAVNQASRDNIFLHYLGPDLRGSAYTSASGLGLTGLQGTVNSVSGTHNTWNNVTNSWVTSPLLTTDNTGVAPDNLIQAGDAYKNQSEVTSKAFVWQAYLFSGNLVPMFGYRKDSETALRKNAASDGMGGVRLNDSTWVLPEAQPDNTQSGTSRTYSVAAHLPRSLRSKLPGNLGLSLYYNKSANFQPDAGRRDIRGGPVPSPTGDTKEYGFAIQALDDKLSLRVTRYETNVINATLGGQIGGQYLIGAVEAWGQGAAYQFRNSIVPDGPRVGNAGTLYGIATNGQPVTWRPAGVLQFIEIPDGPDAGTDPDRQYTYSQAELDATAAREKASVDAWYATQVPADFQAAWALTNYSGAAGSTNFGASGLVVTGDTLSKGTEFELIANPIRGLDISLNASKTNASRANPAKAYIEWITKRQAEFQGPAGDMRLWNSADDGNTVGNGHDGETARGKFARETMAGYNLFRALEGSDVPELRPWRFNVVANYTFQSDSVLKGANIGASYRWQQSNTTGFPVIMVNGAQTFDVEHPYKGSPEGITDLWLGYERKVSQKVRWRIQVNVRDVFATDSLVRVTVQPDGSAGSMRIPEPRTWSISNSFTF